MGVNIYKTDLGLFSIIFDNEIFTNLKNNWGRSGPNPAEVQMYDTNGVTAYGNKLISIIPFDKLYGTLVINTDTYEPTPYLRLTEFMPNVVLKKVNIPVNSSSAQYDYYTLSTDKNKAIKTMMQAYESIADFRMWSKLVPDMSDPNTLWDFIKNGGAFDFPYGYFTAIRGTVSQYIRIGIAIANSDGTEFMSLSIRPFEDGSVKAFIYSYTYSTTYLDEFYSFFGNLAPIYVDSDPFASGAGGSSTTGGGTGDFDLSSDAVDIPELPTLSAVNAGFITLFNPTIAQLSNLASYMWSDLFDVNTFKKIFADPMQAILGLSIVPVSVPNGGERVVKVGNISTGISMTTASSQYVKVDCGTINVNEYWGAYLDYEPFTKAEIYLPYIGIHPLSVDDIMGKPVHVVYHVDILSGACCAYVKCGDSILYSFLGQCASSIPVTGNDWTNVINGVLNIAGSVGSMVATGGATAPTGISTIASTAVNSLKPSVEKSGAMGGTGGMLGVQTPYIILTRPRQAVPSSQNVFTGYPSFITTKLADLSGYTEVYKIHLENIGATEDELNEIESLLKSGVIF